MEEIVSLNPGEVANRDADATPCRCWWQRLQCDRMIRNLNLSLSSCWGSVQIEIYLVRIPTEAKVRVRLLEHTAKYTNIRCQTFSLLGSLPSKTSCFPAELIGMIRNLRHCALARLTLQCDARFPLRHTSVKQHQATWITRDIPPTLNIKRRIVHSTDQKVVLKGNSYTMLS